MNIKIPLPQLSSLSIYIILFLFIAAVLSNNYLASAFEYNPDEGLHYEKSFLYSQGFPLYKSVISDQPPLFTLILAFWFKIFGFSIYWERMLVLIFSLILLWSFYQIIKHYSDTLTAALAVILLILSNGYARLSITAMLPIPAFSSAMLSLYFLVQYFKKNNTLNLALSAFILALSLHIKFSPAFIIPISIILIIIESKKDIQLLYKIGLWLLILAGTYLTIFFAFAQNDFKSVFHQLFLSHIQQDHIPGKDFSLITNFLLQDFDITALGAAGILLLKPRETRFFIPLSWLTLVLLILLKHRPIWNHYGIFIHIPLCWLASIAITEFFRYKNKNPIIITGVISILIASSMIMFPFKTNRLFKSLHEYTSPEEKQVLGLVKKYKPYTRWMVTDYLIYPFYAQIPTVPELTLFTRKRSFQSIAEQDFFIKKTCEYNPEIVLIGRYETPNKILEYLNKNYLLILNIKILKKRKWDFVLKPSFMPYPLKNLVPQYGFLKGLTGNIKIPIPNLNYKSLPAYPSQIMFFIRKDLNINP